jgi:addiction module RelE/StbE family toxin
VKISVCLCKKVEKDLAKVPKNILILFDLWREIIETDGLAAMQGIKGYRDHSLKGQRQGQRSSSLNRSWRIIYALEKDTNLLMVFVLEVNHHDN